MSKPRKQPGRYDVIIVEIFQRHYRERIESFEFSRSEFAEVAAHLGIVLPKKSCRRSLFIPLSERFTKGNIRHCTTWFGMGN